MFEAARAMGLEGIVAKDRRSKYEAARTNHWQKLKVSNEQEFVIAGFTAGEREYFGALVLGVHEGGKLRHAGQVGTGFDHRLMKAILRAPGTACHENMSANSETENCRCYLGAAGGGLPGSFSRVDP